MLLSSSFSLQDPNLDTLIASKFDRYWEMKKMNRKYDQCKLIYVDYEVFQTF